MNTDEEKKQKFLKISKDLHPYIDTIQLKKIFVILTPNWKKKYQ